MDILLIEVNTQWGVFNTSFLASKYNNLLNAISHKLLELFQFTPWLNSTAHCKEINFDDRWTKEDWSKLVPQVHYNLTWC